MSFEHLAHLLLGVEIVSILFHGHLLEEVDVVPEFDLSVDGVQHDLLAAGSVEVRGVTQHLSAMLHIELV